MALLVWLVCCFACIFGTAMTATAVPKSNSNRKNSNEMQRDIRKAVSCENRHPGGGQSCCGGQDFNPETATCCIVKDRYTKTAVTEGLSEKVSACCGLKAYDPLNEMCCDSTIVAKPAPRAACCGTVAINEDTQLCCPFDKAIVQTKNTSDHLCCGHNQFNKKTECCCRMENSLETQPISSDCCRKKLGLCGKKPYNKLIDLCCEPTVITNPPPNLDCCGDKAIDTNTHKCCGPHDDRMIHAINSSDHLCCGRNLYDQKTQCCCTTKDGLKIQPISSECCLEQLCQGLQKQKLKRLNCTEPDSHLCGSTCYNPNDFRCCGKKLGKSHCAQGRFDLSSVYDPSTHVCSDGRVSERRAWIDHAHGSPAQHYCGTEVYSPDTNICCEGHSQHKGENTHCCGVKAYNIKDPRVKCCAGTLHHVAVGHEAVCCGSLLRSPLQNVCCSSEDEAVLYSTKNGFGCCEHFYFNASLWSCCAGNLSPVQQPQQTRVINESRLLSVNNLNDAELCNQMQIGTVQSVSLRSIVFSNALKIHGRNGTVTPLASPYVLKTLDGCSFPKLTPGKNYFFNEASVYSDFNHNSVLPSLHFIISKCYRT